MMARWLCTAMVSALLFGSGCCCMSNNACGPCGPCGPPTCCFSLPFLQCLHPIRWEGGCNECGPSPCQSCQGSCGGGREGLLAHCGLFGGGLGGCLSCKRGCGEVYCDEWKSDPPDCCDPCDQCHGEFTGPHGYCCLGPCQRLLACLDGYRYCPPPNGGPWRPIFGPCNPCGAPACGCGDVGCASCAGGGPNHGGDIHYEGPLGPQAMPMQTTAPRGAPTQQPRNMPAPRANSTSIMEENWETPRTQFQSNKPVRNAQQPQFQMSGRTPPQNATSQRLAQQSAKPESMTQPSASQRITPAQIAARKAAQRRAEAEAAAGIRSANYQR